MYPRIAYPCNTVDKSNDPKPVGHQRTTGRAFPLSSTPTLERGWTVIPGPLDLTEFGKTGHVE